MSIDAFYDGLAEIALGWLGWTEEQALKSDVNAIQIAYAGRIDLLTHIFGKRKDDKPNVASRPLTPQLFDALFSKP